MICTSILLHSFNSHVKGAQTHVLTRLMQGFGTLNTVVLLLNLKP